MNTDLTSPDVHLADMIPRVPFFQSWERFRYRRAHWFVESAAEFGGAFCYCYFGMGATAAFNLGNILAAPGIGSLFTVGFGYAFGIVLALCIFAATSGGHFNPCVTITLCVYRGFPWSKAPRYILSQIFGAYMAAIFVYAQYHTLILEAEAALGPKLAAINFTAQGPAGIFALYVAEGSNLGFVFLNEFVTDVMIGLTIWAALDPTNAFIPPAASPWVIAFSYAASIWGFASVGLAANTARDLGGRLAAMTLWGKAANGGTYAAIAALTSIPAMLTAATIYEFLFTDSSRVVPIAQRHFVRAHQLHQQHRQQVQGVDGRYAHGQSTGVDTGSASTDYKPRTENIEHA